MGTYLADLQGDTLFERPSKEPEEDRDLMGWQVLLHVVNHSTDHRAQVLRLLNDSIRHVLELSAQRHLFLGKQA